LEKIASLSLVCSFGRFEGIKIQGTAMMITTRTTRLKARVAVVKVAVVVGVVVAVLVGAAAVGRRKSGASEWVKASVCLTETSGKLPYLLHAPAATRTNTFTTTTITTINTTLAMATYHHSSCDRHLTPPSTNTAPTNSYDEAHYPNGKPRVLNVWIPFTDASADNGCLWVVPREFDPAYDQPTGKLQSSWWVSVCCPFVRSCLRPTDR
jgi:hypothetical protein